MKILNDRTGGIETFTFLCLVSTVVILLLKFLSTQLRKNLQLTSKLNINGPKPLPIVGNLFKLISTTQEGMESFYKELGAKYKERCKLTAFQTELVFLYNANDVQKILYNSKHLEKSVIYDAFQCFQRGLLTATGHRWLQTRPILDKAFHFKSLQHYRSIFHEKTLQLVEEFRKASDNYSKPVDVFDLVVHCGFDIICATMMNYDPKVLGSTDLSYSNYLDVAADHMDYRMWHYMLYNSWLGRIVWRYTPRGIEEKKAFDWMNNFSEMVIRERRKARESENNDDTPPCLLDICLEAQKQSPQLYNEKDLRDEVNTFLTGGHGATTASTSMMLQLLASHPEIQEKAYAELKEIFGEDTKRALSPEEYNRMNYLECVIKESLRLYPGVPIFPRGLQTDVQLDNGAVLSKGTILFIVSFLLHRDPSVFPNPEKFDPNRFAKDAEKRHPYAFIPFSAGIRNCIGKNFSMLEIKTFLAYILIHFKLEKVMETEDVGILLRIFLKPKNGIVLKLTPR